MMEGFEALCVSPDPWLGEKETQCFLLCSPLPAGKEEDGFVNCGCGDSALSDTGSEGKSCLVATRQGVGEQDPHMAFSDMMKEEDLVATVWG